MNLGNKNQNSPDQSTVEKKTTETNGVSVRKEENHRATVISGNGNITRVRVFPNGSLKIGLIETD